MFLGNGLVIGIVRTIHFENFHQLELSGPLITESSLKMELSEELTLGISNK